MRFTDKSVLITGAGSGIGQAMARLFAEEGANVGINDINADRIAETQEMVEKAGGKALPLLYDITDLDAVTEATQKVIKTFGKLDILCANAGIAPNVPFVDMTPEQWDQMIKVHLYGMYNSCKAVISHMRDNRWGRIIITTSMSAINGDMQLSHYSAAKAGQVGFAKALARESVDHGITVNCVAPGLTQTSILAETSKEVIEKYTPPIGRIGRPEDQAYAALYFASDEAEFVTGHTMQVNGGSF